MKPPASRLLIRLAAPLALLLAGLATCTPARADSVLAAAEAAFERKEWTTALPLLQELAEDNRDTRGLFLEIKKRINVCKDHLTPDEFEKASWKPGMPRIVPKREPHPAPKPGEVRTMGIKLLGNFDYDPEKGGTIPDDVKALTGSTVRLWGYMIPMRQADDVNEFALVPSAGSCCFGQPPGVQHTITVRLPKGTTVKLSVDPVVVTGILKVEEKREDDYTTSIFELAGTQVDEDDKTVRAAQRAPVIPTTAPSTAP